MISTNQHTLSVYRVDKLVKQYHQHGSLIIGVDFDYTIYNPDIDYMHTDIISFLLEAQQLNCKLCLWTANASRIPFILDKCKAEGLVFDHINKSPITIEENVIKPHFNILLDDVAGLSQTLEILQSVLLNIKDLQ